MEIKIEGTMDAPTPSDRLTIKQPKIITKTAHSSGRYEYSGTYVIEFESTEEKGRIKIDITEVSDQEIGNAEIKDVFRERIRGYFSKLHDGQWLA